MIVNPEIDRYLNSLLPRRDEVLADMEAAAAQHIVPIVGPAVGRLLAQLVMITRARRIFELGSAIGYSTIWLARAAGPGSEIHYTDYSEENARLARRYFERAGVASEVQVHVGEALAMLGRTPGEFDLIFNDVDKEMYPAVLEAVPPRLKRGGLLVTDNTLWSERVLDPPDATSRAVVEFNRRLYESSQFYTTLLPLRDGVTVSLKL
ncbi:MAG: O-methyltransferase [Bryobacterales bacterium]|nr:O-methyltransferase [Bryobacterales bacterium]